MSKPINFAKCVVSKMIIKKPEDNERVESQKIGWISYPDDENNEKQLHWKTPTFISESYGIPQEDKFHTDVKSRLYYKLGFCHDRKMYEDCDYDAMEQLMNKFIEIDKMCDTDEFRKKMFGDKAFNQYAYQPLVRFPDNDADEDNADAKPKYRPPCVKIQLKLVYDKNPNASTKPDFKMYELKNGERSEVDLHTFEDVVDLMKFRSKLRFVIHFNKIYAMKTKSGNDKKKYGITIKATHVEFQRPVSNGQSQSNDDVFDDSDTDEVINKPVPTISRNMQNLDVNDSASDQESDNEVQKLSTANDIKSKSESDEEEVVEEPKPKKAITKAAARKKNNA
jgi:hypothetical protein